MYYAEIEKLGKEINILATIRDEVKEEIGKEALQDSIDNKLSKIAFFRKLDSQLKGKK